MKDLTLDSIVDKDLQKLILDKLKDGKEDEHIAIELGVERSQVLSVIESKPEVLLIRDGIDIHNLEFSAILQKELVGMMPLAEVAKREYEIDPTDRNAYAATALTQCIQSLVEDLQKQESTVDEVMKVSNKILQPLLEALLKSVADKFSVIRKGVQDKAPEQSVYIEQLTNDSFKAMGIIFKTEYNKAMTGLAKHYELNKSDKTMLSDLLYEEKNE